MPDFEIKNSDLFDFNDTEGFGEFSQKTVEDGGGVKRPQMNIFFLLDGSVSMGYNGGQRINQLNTAMPIALEAAQDAAVEKEIDLSVRVIYFSDSASWIMGTKENGVDIKEACDNWKDIVVTGSTNTAEAIRLVRTAMSTEYLGTRNYHPVVILITDGESNDPAETRAAIEELRNALSGGDPNKRDKVWRFAIGVEGYNETELLDFATTGVLENEFGDETPGVPMVFKVDNVADLTKALKNVTLSSLAASVAAGSDDSNNHPIITF